MAGRGYPDFPMPQKLRVDQANEPITISQPMSAHKADIA
jgi:hypothetical protein